MGNDCWNEMIVLGCESEIKLFFDTEIKNVTEYEIFVRVNDKRQLHFRIWSKNNPDFEWLEQLLVKYPSLWIKNLWREECGNAGVWIGSKHNIQNLSWFDQPLYDIVI